MALDNTKDPNHLFQTKLGKGQGALKILLDKVAPPQQESPDTDPERRTSGPMTRSRPIDELLARHGGFLNFWDLGQIKSGETWVDIDYKFLNFDNFDVGVVGVDPIGINVQKPRPSDWQGMIDLIMEVPVADWKTQYRKLGYEDAERYGVDMLVPSIDDAEHLTSVGRTGTRWKNDVSLPFTESIDGSHWSSKGLNVKSAFGSRDKSHFGFCDAGVFYFFGPYTPDFADYMKVTSVYDVDAPAVPFSLKPPANVYLVPRMGNLTAWHRPSSHTAEWYFAIGPYRQLQREFWLNRTDSHYVYPMLSSWGFTFGQLDAANMTALHNETIAVPGTRFVHVDASFDNVTELTGPYTGPEFTEWYWELDIGRAALNSNRLGECWDTHPNMLVGVIEQGGTFYYMWRVNGGPQWVGDSGGLGQKLIRQPGYLGA